MAIMRQDWFRLLFQHMSFCIEGDGIMGFAVAFVKRGRGNSTGREARDCIIDDDREESACLHFSWRKISE